MSVGLEQRERLRRTKLAALARDELGLRGEAVTTGPLTGLLVEGTAVVLVERGDAAALTGALVWAHREGARHLIVLADSGAPELARLAGYFTLDDDPVQVHAVVGATLQDPAPAPLPERPGEPGGADDLVAELRSAGVEVVVEHGVVRGEVLGLEVARLVEWPTDVGGDGELHIEVGIGRFDRDATAAVRPDESPTVSLRRAVDMVRAHRYPGAGVHPIQLLSRSRWLRSTVLADPSLVGARSLQAVSMTTEPSGLKDIHPAAALGADLTGRPIVVVCSSGVDLSLLPLAADTRAMHAPDARLVLAVPERDHHVATTTMLDLLRQPAELVAVPPGWG